jgi:hypothetical protein
MKTAVEWLAEQLCNAPIPDYWGLVEQAKEMEKEQMKDSYKQGFAYRDTWNWELNVDWNEDLKEENENEFKKYYNETYKTKTIVTEFRDGSVKVETFKSE